MFEEPIDEEMEDLLSNPPAQFGSGESSVIEKILTDNDNDPAYVLGVLTFAMFATTPEKHTFDKKKLAKRKRTHEMVKDVLRLRRKWLGDYPDLMKNIERRWTSVPSPRAKSAKRKR